MRVPARSVCWLTLPVLLLPACTSQPAPALQPTGTVMPAATAPHAADQRADIEYGSFTAEQLYQAIISELGARRGKLAAAGDNYLDLALETRDAGIIRRAVQFASANNDVNALLQLGLLWTEIEPATPRPHLLLSFQFLETGNFRQALSHMARVLEAGGEIDFSALAARTGQLDRASRADLIEDLQHLTDEFPQQQSIAVTLVQLLAQNGRYRSALTELEQLLQRAQLTPALVRLQAQLLQRTEDDAAAMKTLRRGVRSFPEDRNLRLSYARRLLQNRAFAAARQQFARLETQHPEDWEIRFSVALLDMEMANFKAAAERFSALVAAGQRTDEANYYLGYVNQQLEQPRQAIEYYRAVRIGTRYFLAAQQLATQLSIGLGELDAAHAHLQQLYRGQTRLEILLTTVESGALLQAGYSRQAGQLLERALNRFPNESELLFARVLWYDTTGDQAGAERDLRQIIRMQPDDARALNHLGYMLADRTTRFDEALELLERAIAIDPDDPAIIDSLGWVQYKLGRLDQALANLQRAFAVFPDHEVASHVGEVLWMMGRQQQARQVWLDALEERPDSELLQQVLQRFQVEP